jgi:hypothetical protein
VWGVKCVCRCGHARVRVSFVLVNLGPAGLPVRRLPLPQGPRPLTAAAPHNTHTHTHTHTCTCTRAHAHAHAPLPVRPSGRPGLPPPPPRKTRPLPTRQPGLVGGEQAVAVAPGGLQHAVGGRQDGPGELSELALRGGGDGGCGGGGDWVGRRRGASAREIGREERGRESESVSARAQDRARRLAAQRPAASIPLAPSPSRPAAPRRGRPHLLQLPRPAVVAGLPGARGRSVRVCHVVRCVVCGMCVYQERVHVCKVCSRVRLYV